MKVNKSRRQRAEEIRIEQEFARRGKDAVGKEFEIDAAREINSVFGNAPIREAVLKKMGQYKSKSRLLYEDLRIKFLFKELFGNEK